MREIWQAIATLCCGTNFRALISLAHSQKIPI